MKFRVAPLTSAVQHFTYGPSRGKGDPIGFERSRPKSGGRSTKTETGPVKMFSLTRFLRVRRVYWTVVQELSAYSDRELHDIGIDRIDIPEIARLASREKA